MNLPSGVLGEGGVIVIDKTSLGVEDNILKNRTEFDGVENIWLFLSRKTDSLGVALFKS